MRIRTGLLAGAFVIRAAAALAAGPAEAEAAKAQLLKVDAEFSDAARKIGVGEAFVRYADPDATMLPPGQGPVNGLAGVRAQF